MIHDVDESVRALLKRDALNGSNVEISFEAPNSDWGARRQGPAINAYLYDIREDLKRRNPHWEEIRKDGLVIDRKLPSRYFKLAYLITAWTQRPEDEHRLLAAVLSTFLKADVLPPEILQGSLVEAKDPIRITIGLPSTQDGSISDVWTALGGELKPSLDLVVTAPFEMRRKRHIGPPVREQPRFAFIGADGQPQISAPRVGMRRGAVAEVERAEPVVLEETVFGGRDVAAAAAAAKAADGKAKGAKGTGGGGDDDGPGPLQESGLRQPDRPGRTFWIRSIPPPRP